MGEQQPLVSICMITYNHEAYIAEAIEGVLMQKADFGYRLVIGEDCSTDNTRKICEDYAKQYPNKIEVLKSVKNLGMQPNFIRTFEACTGKYVALCEGDDYWTDSLKLQKQVDFLEDNDDCSFCFHKANKLRQYDNTFLNSYPNTNNQYVKFNAGAFFKLPTIPTGSVLFLNKINYPEMYHSHGDFILYCVLLSKGKGGYIDKVMSVYRIHDKGVSYLFGSKSYITRRIEELFIEARCPTFTKDVRERIQIIIIDLILIYLIPIKNDLSFYYKFRLLGKLVFLRNFYTTNVNFYKKLNQLFW